MDRFNPIQQSNIIKEEFEDFLRSEFHLSEKNLRDVFEKQLKKEQLFKGPYLAMNLPFCRGKSLTELNEEGIICNKFIDSLCDIYPNRPLYVHQEESLRKINEGHSVVITTGTGSGKTESFLYPILNSILKDVEEKKKGKGIKALFLYPMNALINDQIDRVRRLLENTPEVTFGFYTGETKMKYQDAKRAYMKQYGKMHLENELISREEMQKNPPDLLFTNYSMLEYLLIRPNDITMLASEYLDNWRFVVLDEAHTYHGALGIELSYLLRRVAGLAAKTPQFLLTSATLGSEGESDEAILEFAQNLTPGKFVSSDIIFARRLAIDKNGIKYQINVEDYSQILTNYAEKDIVNQIAKKYLPELQSEALDIENILFYLLRADRTVYELYQILKDGVKPYIEVQKELNNKLNGIFSDQNLISLIVLLNRAQLNGLRIFDLKFHSFIRPISGIYMTLGQDKQMKLTQANVIDGKKAFEIGHCRYCNASYIIGKTVSDEMTGIDKLIQNNEIDIYDNYGNKSFSEVEYYLLGRPYGNDENGDEEALKSAKEKNAFKEYTICTKCGCISVADNLNALKCDCGKEYEETVYKAESEDKELRNNIYECIGCGKSYREGVVKTLHLGKDEGTAVVAQILYQSMGNPNFDLNKRLETNTAKKIVTFGAPVSLQEKTDKMIADAKKQLLMFSDSRQQASFAATFLARNHEKMLRKRILWEVIRTLPSGKRSVKDIQNLVKIVLENENLLPSDLKSDAEAWLTLLMELLKVDGVFSSEGLGLYYFELDWDWVEDWDEICEIFKSQFAIDITPDEIKALFNILLDVFKFNGGINLSLGNKDIPSFHADNILQYRNIDFYVNLVKGERDTEKVRSFLPAKGRENKNTRFIEKALGCSPDTAKEIMKNLWLYLDGNGIFDKTVDIGVKLPLEKYRAKSCLDFDVIFYQCDTCGNITPFNVKNHCVSWGCRGKLHKIDAEKAFKNNYYRKQYVEKYIEPMIAVEHTAQLKRQEATQIQKQFKEKAINVLSCSTTFEMGIDIGDLETVFMRNIPPRPDNYVQRAGRAGRGFDSSAYILTYCDAKSHDYTYFLEPEKMIEGRIQPPQFDVLNEKIMLRHLMAASLGFFFKSNSEREKLCSKLDFFETNHGVEEFINYMHSNPQDLKTYLENNVIPHKVLSKYENFKWFIDSTGELLVKDFEDKINQELSQYNERINQLYELKNESNRVQNTEEQNLLEKARDNFRKTPMLELLSKNALIPKYGFPIDVVELNIVNNYGIDPALDITDGKTEKDKLELNRDLSIAISEYAPDSEVIARNKKYVSRYIKMPGRNGAFKPVRFFECSNCKKVNILPINVNESDVQQCKYCGHTRGDVSVQTYIEPRLGFLGQVSKKTKRLKPVRSYLGEVTYLGDGQEEENINLGKNVSLHTSKDDELLVLNRSNFLVCEQCGYSQIVEGYGRKDVAHKNAWGQTCPNTSLKERKLGHKFKTDVINIDVSRLMSSEGKNFKWEALLSFMYAFLEGMSEALQIDRNDLNGLVQPAGQDVFDVLLYDNVPGGAGHVKRLMDKSNFINCLKWTWKKVNQDCCDIDSSCYSCLRNYSNQRYHGILSRKEAQDVVKSIALDLNIDLE